MPAAIQPRFNVAASGEKITGLPWQESLTRSTRVLAALPG
jgi:hypothetical protein